MITSHEDTNKFLGDFQWLTVFISISEHIWLILNSVDPLKYFSKRLLNFRAMRNFVQISFYAEQESYLISWFLMYLLILLHKLCWTYLFAFWFSFSHGNNVSNLDTDPIHPQKASMDLYRLLYPTITQPAASLRECSLARWTQHS